MKIEGSFRDPGGFVFRDNGAFYRIVSKSYAAYYDMLLSSGLYADLVAKDYLLAHEEVHLSTFEDEHTHRIIKPTQLSFISYPYEWCFSALKDAALLTLAIQKIAIAHGMSLRDGSAYNIQFFNGRPIFIDTLSFEPLPVGKPWVAYRQFCQHFLAPLALMTYCDVRLGPLVRLYIDGIPLDLTARLLPARALLNPALLMHLYLHAKSQKYFSEKTEWLTSAHFSTTALLALIDNLESTIKGLRPKKIRTQWADYYHDINYTAEAFETKKRVIAQWIENIRPAQVWDLGANKGLFSRIAAAHSALVVSFDIDPLASEANYIECKKQTQHNILPLVIDLNNPSPAIGWHNKERMTLSERGPADMLLALALIHHLAITNNLPFEVIARFFHDLSKILVIEFVPKHDSQVQRLLSMRKDIFEKYTQAEFERTFAKYFVLKQQIPINDSVRTLYLMSAAADG